MDTDKKSSEVSLTSDLYEVDVIDQPRINNGLRRILCITIVICGMFFNGVVYGFPSPAELSFKKDHKIKNYLDRIFPNDLKLTSEETNYFASFSQIGFPIGGLLCGVMVTLMGKRFSCLFGLAFSYILGHSLILVASNVEMLYGGRIFSGVCQGFCNCLNYIYILDFCHNVKEKAICGVILALIGNSGTLIIYILGIFLNWRQLAGVCVLCGVPYVLGLIVCLPNDFPYRKMSRGKSYSTTTKLVDEDSDLTYGPLTKTKQKLEKQDFKKVISNLLCKSLLICIGMMFFYQFAGYAMVISFAGDILQKDEEMLDKNGTSPSVEFLRSLDPALLSACLVALAGLIGVILGIILVHMNFNRKRLLLGSAFGTVVSFAGLGIYYMTANVSPQDFPLTPTICLVSHVLLFNVGYGPLTYCLMAEILPAHIRTKGMAILMVFGGLFGFLNLKSKYFLESHFHLGPGPIYLLYAGVNLTGFIYLQFFLPNTDSLT